ncbi:Yip1 family protein [Rummeliibacillus pycnus]|uniref:Yip1 family protein n=1 Tax=Rummeliibacillus pycnus TaxID=101070 RepID=UPI000C9CAA8F|nr:Yip1 family protein [Rummeliibacillus pycnus]
MNQPQKQPQNYEIQPFFSTWLHPKKTAQYLIDHKKWTYALIFVLLGGMASGITGLEDTTYYPTYSTWILLLGCIVAGPFIGIVSVSISTFFTWLIGKIFGGKGSFEDIFKVTSLTAIPTIGISPFLLVWMANFPLTYFDTGQETNLVTIMSAIVFWLVTLVTGIWAFVINVAGVAIAHRFSNWKAFFTIIIPGIILLLVVIGLVLLFLSFAIL